MNLPKHSDNLVNQLRNDPEYATMWAYSILQDYAKDKDIAQLEHNLKPLMEAMNDR